MIFVCSLAELPRLADRLQPTHVVSLLGDDPFPQTPASVRADCHLKLRLHDIIDPAPGFIAPGPDHMESLIAFGACWSRSGPLIIHCYAGVSRSTAAALAILVLYNRGREAQAVRILRERAPHAYPNRRMVSLADGLLGCEGRLIAAVSAITAPDFLTPLQTAELPARLE